MARCNPCLLLIPLPIVACRRSGGVASTWFASIVFLFFWVALFTGITECARKTCADAATAWAFLVFFYVFALFLQIDLFNDVSYKERRDRFRDEEEREKRRKEFRNADSVAPAGRDSINLDEKINDKNPPMTKVELRKGRLQREPNADNEENNENDPKTVRKQLNALNANNTDRRKSAFYVRGDRVPRFSDVV